MSSTDILHGPDAAPTELDQALAPIAHRLEEILDRLETVESQGVLDEPDQVARAIDKLDSTLRWDCLHKFNERLARMEGAIQRIEERLP